MALTKIHEYIPALYRYVEPGEKEGDITVVCMTEDQILKEYFPVWKARMEKAGKHDLISPQNCIEDWCTVHWARKVRR